mmetsp:Transcript_4165/g.7787  ORF Transcript_4165/g.7787 Transcript_4165/m.7787 type:complete len:452 (+) Transcript_4165:101-1456(+)|eukprot:CAMPEP_0182508050 /NCGR_PEP_ID=MMETSP1321-20130603/24312_1 /TAXON_ID=91990 /ORGANISM="Bolidomonas sp., Strain RCC1657" /LENGTH=451 /DNA_ID=CAMNT_0024714061 /DNA_START=74 /DNA_END=1429 /DNA_ORIENTATION=+
MATEVRGATRVSKVVPVIDPTSSPRNSLSPQKVDDFPEAEVALEGGSWVTTIRKLSALANSEGFDEQFKTLFDDHEASYLRWKEVFDKLFLFGEEDLIAVVTRGILSSVDLSRLRALEELCSPTFFNDSGLLVAVRRRILEVLQQSRLRQQLASQPTPAVVLQIPQEIVPIPEPDDDTEISKKQQLDIAKKMEPAMFLEDSPPVQVTAVDEEILDACAALGVACSKDRQFEQARLYYKLALDGYEAKLGKNSAKGLKVEYSLVCCSCESKHVMTEKLEMLVQKMEEVLGKEHMVTLDALNSYGARLDNLGKYELARHALEKCMASQERVLGPHHTKTLMTVCNLGLVYKHLQMYENALELYERDLADCERLLGKDHPSTLMTVENIGNLKMDGMKEFKEAELYYERALRGYKSQLGKYHEGTMKCVKNFKSCLKASNNAERLDKLKDEYPS